MPGHLVPRHIRTPVIFEWKTKIEIGPEPHRLQLSSRCEQGDELRSHSDVLQPGLRVNYVSAFARLFFVSGLSDIVSFLAATQSMFKFKSSICGVFFLSKNTLLKENI